MKQLQIAEEVENSCGIPGAVGFIDGTHIRPTHAPNGDYDYYNRKGNHSFNCRLHIFYTLSPRVIYFFHNYNCQSFVLDTDEEPVSSSTLKEGEKNVDP